MSGKILLNIEIIVETCCFFVTTNSVCFQFLFEKWQVQPVVILCSILIYGTWSTQESIIIICSTFEIDFLFSNGCDNNKFNFFFDFIVAIVVEVFIGHWMIAKWACKFVANLFVHNKLENKI